MREHAQAMASQSGGSSSATSPGSAVFDEALSSFFRNVQPSRTGRGPGLEVPVGDGQQPIYSLRARAVCVDMEEGVLNEVKRGPLGELFDENQFIRVRCSRCGLFIVATCVIVLNEMTESYVYSHIILSIPLPSLTRLHYVYPARPPLSHPQPQPHTGCKWQWQQLGARPQRVRPAVRRGHSRERERYEAVAGRIRVCV